MRFALLLASSLLSSLSWALPLSSRSTNIVAFDSLGGVSAVQTGLGGTRILYQANDGSLQGYSTDGPFDTGGNNDAGGSGESVPASEVMLGTPIVGTAIGQDEFVEAHFFYLSPTHVVSELIFTASTGAWRSGSNCADCLTAHGFVADRGTDSLLYALQNPNTGGLRVGFFSAAEPGTLVEADKSSSTGTWDLATLPGP